MQRLSSAASCEFSHDSCSPAAEPTAAVVELDATLACPTAEALLRRASASLPLATVSVTVSDVTVPGTWSKKLLGQPKPCGEVGGWCGTSFDAKGTVQKSFAAFACGVRPPLFGLDATL